MNANTPGDFRVLLEAMRLASKGKLRRALMRLDEHTFEASMEVFALIVKAQILEEVGTEECWRTYAVALKKYPDNAAVNLRAGVFVYHRGDLAKAEVLLMRSWHAGPMPETGYYLGMINDARCRRDEALGLFIQTTALEGEPGHWRKRAEAELLLQGEPDNPDRKS